ncbi:MAG: hypothetical protein AB7V50_06420 [Vampirovibrionia bacterium]
MRLLQTTLQAIAGILILTIPIILVYTVLLALDIEPLNFITNFLGMFILPFTSIVVGLMGEKTMQAGAFTVNLAPIFLCGVNLCLAIILTLIAKFLQGLRSSLSYVQAKTDVHVAKKQREMQVMQEEQKLFQNTIAYVVVRYKTQTTSSAYLVSSGLSETDIKNMFMEPFNRYMYLDAQLHRGSTDTNFQLIFEEVPNSVNYALTLMESILNVNRSLDKAGIKQIITAGIYCAPPEESKDNAFHIANKVCNLAAPGEVSCSREVKDIYEKDRSDHNLRYISRGMYDLGQEVEIYSIEKIV